eukprot:1888979-Ditylum_brightwellii.AAC.1
MEEIPQNKGGGEVLCDREFRALRLLCKKPSFSKDISLVEEIPQSKRSGALSYEKEIRALTLLWENPVPEQTILSWKRYLRAKVVVYDCMMGKSGH